ncbi:MAG: hypothetical protein EON54_20130 [Alcaligenaceae bacterium]|nr:MAG: hypothetical protein EON54_20130 [Alcaligenaceae bacterium]
MKRIAVILVVTLAIAVSAVGVTGYFLYTNSRIDPIEPVDAIIVLGGEHDGREDYAFELARSGVTTNVVLSNPYSIPYSRVHLKMATFCETNDPEFTTICVAPHPSTTRGEGEYTYLYQTVGFVKAYFQGKC